MLYPVERRGRKRVQSSASLYPLIYRHAQQFVESLVASACASPAGPIIHAAQLTKSGSRPARADPISLKGESLSSGRTSQSRSEKPVKLLPLISGTGRPRSAANIY